jgi:hypothetical protein
MEWISGYEEPACPYTQERGDCGDGGPENKVCCQCEARDRFNRTARHFGDSRKPLSQLRKHEASNRQSRQPCNSANSIPVLIHSMDGNPITRQGPRVHNDLLTPSAGDEKHDLHTCQDRALPAMRTGQAA